MVDAISINRQLIGKKIECDRLMFVCIFHPTKASDKVGLRDAIKSLEKTNVDYIYQRIIKEFRMKAKEGLSEEVKIYFGIRQGDCLSPTLFNIVNAG